jgi:hypothetical protein
MSLSGSLAIQQNVWLQQLSWGLGRLLAANFRSFGSDL